MTRAKFEELNLDLFRSTLKPVQKVLEDADMKKRDVHEIVLVSFYNKHNVNLVASHFSGVFLDENFVIFPTSESILF